MKIAKCFWKQTKGEKTMENRIDSNPVQINVEPARSRQAPDNSFSAMLARGAKTAALVAGETARTVASYVPGGSFLTAVASAVSPDGVGSRQGSEKWQLLEAQNQMQEEGMENSLRLLALQRKMQEETQSFTTTSNVMKTRHEMAKSAINNIR
jgi:hypothetical protein